MIKPIINEVFPSTGIMIRNKYIDCFRRAYFINKIYECGIKNIEVGTLSKGQNFINGICDSPKGFLKIKNEVIIKPYINQLVYHIYSDNDINIKVKGMSINGSIKEFVNIKETLKLPTKLIIEGDIRENFKYIYNNTLPDIVEVSNLNQIILNSVDNSKLSVRPSTIQEIDKAYYEQIYKYSSSILTINNHVDTITLIKHLQNKMGVEIPVSITGLTNVKKEIEDEFNW